MMKAIKLKGLAAAAGLALNASKDKTNGWKDSETGRRGIAGTTASIIRATEAQTEPD
jgi:hypothetical protein